ncbi:hypothetical protein SETIT_4G028300v2 [Setaria italica]|uniref:Uncharacterized protein n=1 Tax=Setaria italica TaxID=4555 RepID=A0A368QQ38_SETIT|nr:hypothetical protein SETIT_4G028300v2 [Setaria italica]
MARPPPPALPLLHCSSPDTAMAADLRCRSSFVTSSEFTTPSVLQSMEPTVQLRVTALRSIRRGRSQQRHGVWGYSISIHELDRVASPDDVPEEARVEDGVEALPVPVVQRLGQRDVLGDGVVGEQHGPPEVGPGDDGGGAAERDRLGGGERRGPRPPAAGASATRSSGATARSSRGARGGCSACSSGWG